MPNLDVPTLTGWHLDYYTGVALCYEMLVSNDGAGPAYLGDRQSRAFEPSSNPDDLMPALQRMDTVLWLVTRGVWHARAAGRVVYGEGETLPVAVCRALVRAVLGATVPALGSDSCEDLFA